MLYSKRLLWIDAVVLNLGIGLVWKLWVVK